MIEGVFKAEANSVLDTFNCYRGVTGFRIPIYQRRYNWSKENIKRLFEDVLNGLYSLHDDPESITFIGTIILIDEEKNKEASFDGHALSVVDGQQRLTTLVLSFCILQERIRGCLNKLESQPDSNMKNWLIEEANTLQDNLYDCIIGSPSSRNVKDFSQHFPRIVRQDGDYRGKSHQDTEYKSYVASYLFQYGKHVYDNNQQEFLFKPNKKDDEYDRFAANISTIKKNIKSIEEFDENNEDSKNPTCYDLMENDNYRKPLFKKLTNWNDSIKEFKDSLSRDSKNDGLLRLIAFGSYFLNKVAFTKVEAGSEKYAFDIFEALNTTGEPLTAIETFKPRVIEYEEAKRDGPGYIKSESHQCFEIIDQYLSKFEKAEDQQNESKEIVVLFALYVAGDTLGKQLYVQRKFLRNKYGQLKDGAKTKFLKSFVDLIEYRRKFWNDKNLQNQLTNSKERDLVLMCLKFIKDMKNSLAIPILARYFSVYQATGNEDQFLGAVKLVTAFLTLRRAATGGTSGIDSDYRAIMSKGGIGEKDNKPLRVGLSEKENDLPPLDDLKEYFKSYLHKMGVRDFQSWIGKLKKQPLNKPTALCRFLLLCAAHNSIPHPTKPYLLQKARTNRDKDYLNLIAWKSEDFESVEHIAPVSNPGTGWVHDIYEDPDLKDTIGNLILLPKNENSALGNYQWAKKKLFYQVFSAETKDNVSERLREAKNQGLEFGEKTKKLINKGSCLPIVATISKATTWDADVIRERTENIGTLVWKELAGWLGFSVGK